MTALGLAVAVPAVLGYNWLVRQNRLNTYVIKSFGSELHTLFLIEGDLPDDDGLAPEADSVTS
jgi:biopolymer transport protein ExbB